MTPSRIKRIGWAASALWAGVIFVLSSIPGSNLPGGYSVQAHFIEYAVLGGLLYFSLRFDLAQTTALIAAVAIASLYGISDELHQVFVPLRSPDPVDWLVDTAGAIAGAALVAGALRLRDRRRQGGGDPADSQ